MSDESPVVGPRAAYVLGHSDREVRRLAIHAELVDPITHRFLRAAGIGPGMRVLAVGSGAGHVAMLAAELVGPEGQVVGVDRAAEAVATAETAALGSVVFSRLQFGAWSRV